MPMEAVEFLGWKDSSASEIAMLYGYIRPISLDSLEAQCIGGIGGCGQGLGLAQEALIAQPIRREQRDK
jgi:hypothetical protein